MRLHEENLKQQRMMVENLKKLRENRNWSIEDLSQISGISKDILTDVEREKDFGLEVLFRLCRIYGIKVHEIFAPLEYG